MSTQHTPGPWEVAVEIFDNEGQPETAIQALNGAATVAVALEFGPNNPHMREANARLIAAAPDLIELLQTMPHPEHRTGITHLTDEWCEWDAKRRAAIAKAMGAA